jgi:membrane fusion protein, heavy metal efflux system
MLCKIVKYGILVICLGLFPLAINAHMGDSHDSSPIKPTAHKPNEFRLQKAGDVFEVVLTIFPDKNPNTVIYVSDPDSNRPIGEAQLLFKVNSTEVKADKTDKKGIYQSNIPLDASPTIILSIQKETFQETYTFENVSLSRPHHSTGWWMLKVAGFLLILGLISFAIRKHLGFRFVKNFSIIILCPQIIINAYSHGDAPSHSYQGEQPSHSEDKQDEHGIITQSTGTLSILKEMQFHLGIVTERVSEKPLKGSVRLMGTVISDPSGYARLQATQSARVINHPDYPLPLPGQAVKRDQVILAVVPTLTKVESTDQKNTLYKTESEITQKHKEVERLQKLGQFAAKKDLENAQAELERALKQKEEITNQTFKPELLKSPLDGFISDLHVRPGEIVTSDKTIVEIVDPTKHLIEALVFDPDVANQITGGYVRLPLNPNNTIPVKILGISPKVNREDQSIHIQLKPDKIDPEIKLDMVVEVIGELKETKPALVVPRKAIIEDIQGSWAFIHTNPETFEPRKVRVKRTIEDMVEIEEGLNVGEKIVTEGAYLLNQAK